MGPDLHKMCSICGLEKSLTLFRKDKKFPDGTRKHCNKCASLRNRAYNLSRKTIINRQALDRNRAKKPHLLIKDVLISEGLRKCSFCENIYPLDNFYGVSSKGHTCKKCKKMILLGHLEGIHMNLLISILTLTEKNDLYSRIKLAYLTVERYKKKDSTKKRRCAQNKNWRLVNPNKAFAIEKNRREKLTDGYVRLGLKRRGLTGAHLKNVELLSVQRLIIKTIRLCKTSQS